MLTGLYCIYMYPHSILHTYSLYVHVLTCISRCQGYKRVIKVIQFLPVYYYYYTVGKGLSWYNYIIAWDPRVLCNIHSNSPLGLRPRVCALRPSILWIYRHKHEGELLPCILREFLMFYIMTTPYLPCNITQIEDFYYMLVTLTTGYKCNNYCDWAIAISSKSTIP